jgi:hypothetical protein
MMNRTVLLSVVVLGLAGCATPEERLDKGQAMALESATARARFEMSCPEAQGHVLSRTLIEPPFHAMARGVNGVDVSGVELAEYTVGVQGCGRRMTQVVACAVDGTGCFSTAERP